MITSPTLTITVEHFQELTREAYKQGYLNCRSDAADKTAYWNDGEEDFDHWLAESMEDGSIGDIQIEIQEV